MGGWVDGHFDIVFDILLKPPQPFTGLFCLVTFPYTLWTESCSHTNIYIIIFI